ncbi:hypothetical protein SAMN05216525_12553 [Bradyrhizobium sp. Gha]|nr:hypothetical protein SAMN05216525_12553 [Bradyrhizobium sp. Gha]
MRQLGIYRRQVLGSPLEEEPKIIAACDVWLEDKGSSGGQLAGTVQERSKSFESCFFGTEAGGIASSLPTQSDKQMRGPELRRLGRSLRTKSYAKLQIRKYLSSLSKPALSQKGDVPPFARVRGLGRWDTIRTLKQQGIEVNGKNLQLPSPQGEKPPVDVNRAGRVLALLHPCAPKGIESVSVSRRPGFCVHRIPRLFGKVKFSIGLRLGGS